jgi:hypothetical protein
MFSDCPDVPLDELVARKKINADQKAQILKKPGLQAELARLEDQVVHYRKFGKDYEDRAAREKAALEESHADALAKVKLEAADEATVTNLKKFDDDLLVLSQFLHAAAAKRQDDELDPVEKAAFEGVLLLVYQGNNAALAAFKDIAAGSDKKVSNTEGDELDFTYAQVKEISISDAPPPTPEEPTMTPSAADAGAAEVSTDPTIANAGMTELEDTMTFQKTDEPAEVATMAPPEQSSITADAANAVAERSWDPQASMTSDSHSGEGWVEVPRDPAETDTGVAATPAVMHNSTSWAEEVNADAAAEEKPIENDGFEQVVHHQNRGRGRGQRGDFRGRGRGGDQRGRGRGDRERGDGDRRGGGRGRGRGGEGGFRGGSRGGRGREGSGPKPAEGASGGGSGGW